MNTSQTNLKLKSFYTCLINGVRGLGRILTVMCFTSLLSSPATALTYLVTSAGDSVTGDPANCTTAAPQGSCTLRDALAAADQTVELDTIRFDIEDTLYIQKQLTASHPVAIDGQTADQQKTILRVDQGYTVVELTDRFQPPDPIAVLQPAYHSNPGPVRPMLELRGSGSTVRNLIFDGSITPQASDLGVARVDYNADNVTDFLLFTLAADDGQSRWPIAAGIYAAFEPTQPGQVDIIENEFRNHDSDAIGITFCSRATVSGNLISGGLAGKPFASGSGIFIYTGANLTVTNNTVATYREGISLTAVSGISVLSNELTGNRHGLHLEYSDTSYGDNLIEANSMSGNYESGMVISSVAGLRITDNKVMANGVFGIDIKGAGYINVTSNKVMENGTDSNFHGGIRIAEQAGANNIRENDVKSNSGFGIVIDTANGNTVQNNRVKHNGGAGIVLLDMSQANTVVANNVKDNQVGILSLSFTGQFPAHNSITDNVIRNSAVYDVADYDPNCDDYWSGNEFGSVNPESGSCIH